MAGTLAAFASCGRCTPFPHRGFPPAHAGGASRSPSRCLASSRSVKSTRSASSATSCRSCSTSWSTTSLAAAPLAGPVPPRSRSANALPTGERALIQAKKPLTATMGISSATTPSMTPSRSARRREPLSLALLGEQPLRKVHPLGQLRELAAHLLQLGRDLLQLGRVAVLPARAAADPL